MTRDSVQIIGVIGARSGSKGIPDKNIKFLAGKPLMAWIIEASRKSKMLNRVIVSTDSEEYARIAREYGAEVPYLRPREYSEDTSPDFDYIVHMVQWLRENEGYIPDIVVRLVPTAPLQLPEDIDECVAALVQDPAAHSGMVIAVARQHPEKALKVSIDQHGGRFLSSYRASASAEGSLGARQEFEPAYFRANVIATRLRTLDEMQSLTGDRICFHMIPQERAIDIDSPIDFFIAEQLIKKFKRENVL